MCENAGLNVKSETQRLLTFIEKKLNDKVQLRELNELSFKLSHDHGGIIMVVFKTIVSCKREDSIMSA